MVAGANQPKNNYGRHVADSSSEKKWREHHPHYFVFIG